MDEIKNKKKTKEDDDFFDIEYLKELIICTFGG